MAMNPAVAENGPLACAAAVGGQRKVRAPQGMMPGNARAARAARRQTAQQKANRLKNRKGRKADPVFGKGERVG